MDNFKEAYLSVHHPEDGGYYASDLKVIEAHIPKDIQIHYEDIKTKMYGAYLCQNDSDPSVCGPNEFDTYTQDQIRDVLINLTNHCLQQECFISPAIGHVTIALIMSTFNERLAAKNSKRVVASVIKYFFAVLYIRERAYVESLKKVGAANYKLAHFNLEAGDPRLSMLWENIPVKLRRALKYMGDDIDCPILEEDRARHNIQDTPDERVRRLFLSPRYRAYKQFVYDAPVLKNSVGWVKDRAYNLLSYVSTRDGWSEEVVNEFNSAISTYTDSMKVSTTGHELCSTKAVFAPKSVEADRLLTNLFKFHLTQLLTPVQRPMLEVAAAAVADFSKFEASMKKSPSRNKNPAAK